MLCVLWRRLVAVGGVGPLQHRMELEQGDIMVMDIRLLHHGTANRAKDPRTLLYVQYVQDFFIDRGNCAYACAYTRPLPSGSVSAAAHGQLAPLI